MAPALDRKMYNTSEVASVDDDTEKTYYVPTYFICFIALSHTDFMWLQRGLA